ncbi:MAG: hypoxanthine phosphoribosyltransferase [Clostridia bacterium]|jgi:hypoxanthine phosphoribosyltransferase|nr:hypoxanthine phosphoribosyltransferase [Clostridiales bacterium]MDK2985965.1 hypoxanthine phosphoribosyltransferase [Clostridia bacterium]
MKNTDMEQNIKEVLVDEETIARTVKELGKQITEDYKGKELIVVGILKGAIMFLSDLVREVKIPLILDFMSVSSYGDSTQTSGAVRFLKDLEVSIEGKHVLIVEDIVDTGLTFNYLLDNLRSRKPASLKTCTFLDKPSRRKADVQVDYKGLEVPDEFVVGYGLDFAEEYRNLPYIAVLKPEVYENK